MRIDIKGRIISDDYRHIYEYLGMSATSPAMVLDALKANPSERAEVYINSGGGAVFAGSEIYTELKKHPGGVTVYIVGQACSAASVIAMAGNPVMMSPTAVMMIHNASTYSEGDKNDMNHSAGLLDKIDRSICNAYIAKTGKKREELLELMNRETWFTAEDAIEQKFADGLMDNAPVNDIDDGIRDDVLAAAVRRLLDNRKNHLRKQVENLRKKVLE